MRRAPPAATATGPPARGRSGLRLDPYDVGAGAAYKTGGPVKGSDKPKKLQKKVAQKTLKEKRTAKKAKRQER